MHVVIDAVVIIISYLAAWLLKFVGPFSGDAVRSLSFEWYMTALFGIVPVYLILYYAFNLYTPKRVQGRRLEFSNIVKANTVGLLLLIGGIYVLLKEINFSRDMLFYFYFINMCLEELVRMAIRYLVAGYPQERTESEAYLTGWLQQGSGRIYRPDPGKSAVGLSDSGNPR